MKLILLRPNYKSQVIAPPLGIGYLSSYIKKYGIEVKIIDGLRDRLSNEQILKKTLAEKPDMVGISCLTAFYNEVVNLSKIIKAHSLRCVIGGFHPTFLPYSTLLDTRADFVICGEGEIALLELIKNNFNNYGIRGVYSKKDLRSDDDLIEKSEVFQNLDEIPFPDWEQLRPDLYLKAPHGAVAKNFPIGTVITTRGCPYECAFCASPRFYDRKLRFRSPENVIKEIRFLIEAFGVKEIHFEDDNLTFKKEHIEQICNLIISDKLRISWACPNGIRADKVDENLIKLMAKSGCYYFAYGIESANPTILNNVKKHINIEMIKKSIDLASKQKIICMGLFIFGLPGETSETIRETINFSKRTKLSRALFTILDVIPGSGLWYALKGRFKPNWYKNSYKEPEWIPEHLTKMQLKKAQAEGFRVFYLRPSIIFKLLKLIRISQIKFFIQRLTEYRILSFSFIRDKM